MTLSQQNASNPTASIWVAANAGTGKTKVLTDRILRLLLKNCRPDSILCLTFTKEAAREMQTRLRTTLKEWVALNDDDLQEAIYTLTAESVSKETIASARQLERKLVKTSVQIQTLHSLCHSLLKIFPLEAGLTPHFTVADEIVSSKLQRKAEKNLLSSIATNDAMKSLYESVSAWGHYQFSEVISQICQNYETFTLFFSTYTLETAYKKLLMIANIKKEKSLDVRQKEFSYAVPSELLVSVASLLENEAKQHQKISDVLKNFLHSSYEKKCKDNFAMYVAVFLTQAGEKRVSLYFTKKMSEDHPILYNQWKAEQERVYDFCKTCRLYHTIERTHLMYHFAFHYINTYQHIKKMASVLDFSDLIFYANKLLNESDITPWILYKLDYKIEHILVDEAQDTNPAQWGLLKKLSQEWYNGQGNDVRVENGLQHSIFVVGDIKQSIYRFQGADPKEFFLMHNYYKKKSLQAHIDFHNVALEHSFRSTKPILSLVDKVSTSIMEEFGQIPVMHKVTRIEEQGKIVLWKLCASPCVPVKKDSNNTPSFCWAEKNSLEQPISAQEILAQKIAATIHHWLEEKTILPSRNRPILPKDILILVRQRGSFVESLTKALENRAINVMGCDRFSLKDTLVIKDLLSVAQVALFVKDDLTFSTLCKSPFIQMSEEMLFDVAHKRGEKSIYENIKEKSQKVDAHEAYVRICHMVENYKALAKTLPPYDFYMHILYVEKGICRLTEKLGKGITASISVFLEKILLYENSHTPSLHGFLEWFMKNDTNIQISTKTHAEDHVRIMTIHGSKGLQAPIVFLPTTTSQPSMASFFSWTEEGIMLWPDTASSGNRDEISKALCASFKKEERAEYMRLLYVALTRAEDQLYIGGYEEGRSSKEENWYEFIEKLMKEMEGVVENEEGLVLEEKTNICDKKEMPVVSRKQAVASPLPAHMFEKVKNTRLNILAI